MSIIYKGFLSGLSHHSYERFKSVLGKGTLLQLKAMPANQFDNYSVAVFFEDVQIGWIPKGQNAEVHSILQVCDQVDCVIVDHLNSYSDLRMRLAVEVSLRNYPGPGANKTATMLQRQLERNRQRQVAAKQGQPAQGQPEQPQPEQPRLTGLVYQGFVRGLTMYGYSDVARELTTGTGLGLRLVGEDHVEVLYQGQAIGHLSKVEGSETAKLLRAHQRLACFVFGHYKDHSPLTRLEIYIKAPVLISCPSPAATNASAAEVEDQPLSRQQVEHLFDESTLAKHVQTTIVLNEPCTTILRTTINTSPTIEKEITMTNKITAIASGIAASNFSAAKTAAVMEAGRIANVEITKVLAKRLPMMVKGYADTPAGRLVVANLAGVALQQFRPNDARLKALVDAMQVQAYQELLQTIDIEGFIDGLLENPKIKNAVGRLTAED